MAGAEIGVDEIDADGVLLHPDLARPGSGNGDILVSQNLRAAHFVHAHHSNHFSLLPKFLSRVRDHRSSP